MHKTTHLVDKNKVQVLTIMYIENRNVFNFLPIHPLSQTPLIQPTPVQFRVRFVRWRGGGGDGVIWETSIIRKFLVE